jgi:uncharacterized membrane protein
MNTLYILLCAAVGLTFYGMGEVGSKLWSMSPSWWLGGFIVVVYSAAILPWLLALRQYGQLSALTTAWSCAYVVVGVMVGVGFGEAVTLRQAIGMLLAIIAILLVY